MPGSHVTCFQKRGAGDNLPRKNQAVVQLVVCVFCRRFFTQTRMIGEQAGNLAPDMHLSGEEKRKMDEAIRG
jgi:hypothetical protein